MKTHRLKTWPSEWSAVHRAVKLFDVRVADRDFAIGDAVELDEWDPNKGRSIPGFGYSGRVLTATISYVLHGGRFGLPEGVCVFSLTNVVERYRSSFGELVPTEPGTK